MNIILAGYIANEATHMLIERERPALRCRFSDRFLRLTDEMTGRNHVTHDSITSATEALSIKLEEDDILELSEMGIYGGLWDFSERAGHGINIYLDKINIRQETIEISELLDINPYTYPSKGAWLIKSDRAHELVDALMNAGINASIIGTETNTKDRIIINQGVVRYLTPVSRLLKDEQGQKNLR